tara:strand:- start:53 stop:2368 length:2316 start_codon:yes stop_codon:yes gene_type:complete
LASFKFCIEQAIKDKKITKDVADQLRQADDPEVALKNMVETVSREKREKAVDAVRISVALDKINNHPEGAGVGLISLLGRDLTGKAGYMNIDLLSAAYTKQYMAKFADGLSTFRTRMLGLSQDEESLNMFIKAVYGETVGDPKIQKIAKDWAELAEDLRVDFNSKGGSISKNENWLFPQNHDMRLIKNAGPKEWKAFISNKLDRPKMLDDNGKPLTDAQIDEALDYVYQTIATGGMNKAKGLTVPRGLGSKLSRKGSEQRFLFFKDANSWIAYQNKFGKGDVLTTLSDHIQGRATDIAMVQTLGTNPRVMYDALKFQAKKIQVDRGKPIGEASLSMLDAVYKTVSGEINGGQMVNLADGMQFVRNLQVASKLGGATLSSFTDIATASLTAHYNNIPMTKVFKRHMSLLTSSEEDKILLARMGLALDSWYGRAHSANRFSDTYGTGASAKTAEAVLRLSGLEAWTESGRKAFGIEFAGMLSDNFGKTVDELHPSVQRAFKTYGINKQDWDSFRNTKPLEMMGTKVADLTADKSMKFHAMILQETDFAVPTPGARERAIATGGLERGTVWGQISRSAMMIKSFPITMATTHLYRGATQATMGGRVQYLGALLGSTTLLGAFALQVKDVAAGRETRDMDASFWVSAFVQGGGASLAADFVVSDVNKYGKGFLESLAGPMGSLVNDTFNLTIGNVRQAIAGDETNVLGEATKFIEDITPGVWQTQLLMDSMFDNIRMMADPNFEKSLSSVRQKRMKEYGQGYWWEPGETPLEVLE